MNERQSPKVIVDAGHGGSDPGAIGNSLKEKDLTLEAARYMYRRLQELGIPVEITRDSDETLPKQQRIDRIKRLIGNDEDVILVANHINAGGGEGAEIVYALRNSDTLANMALNNIGEAGQVKRKVYQRRLPENPNLDYYYILRETGSNTEPILVEYGFIDNANDAKKLQNNLLDYVEGVVKAIAEYTNRPYSPPGSTDGYYTVQKGDTLYSIARKFNTTVDNLRTLNNLISDTLQIGQTIKVSGESIPEQNYINYTVQKGDTLYKIATLYNTTPEELKSINNLNSNTLLIGQILKVPAKANNDTVEYDIYTVQKGDSLWSISRKYNITVDKLLDLNDLSNTVLQLGQILKVPKTSIPSNTYTVKSGDTLWSIAKQNNISVDSLKSANNLSSNLLSVGQTLIIPN